MIADEPIYSITSKITTTPSTRQRKLEIDSWPSPLAGPTRQTAALDDLEGGMPGESAGILPAWGRHGGSNRQGEFMKSRYFVVRTGCGRDARAPRGGGSPKRFRFAEIYPVISLAPWEIESRLSPTCTSTRFQNILPV